ncbi:MAG: hypothetical protein AVDCRST_MAG45-2500, partial [uncultured Solirubrobacterales bacterium]
ERRRRDARARGSRGRRPRPAVALHPVPPRAAAHADVRAPAHAPRGDRERHGSRAGAARLPRRRLLPRLRRSGHDHPGHAAGRAHRRHRLCGRHRGRLLRPPARRARAPREPRPRAPRGHGRPRRAAGLLLPRRRRHLRRALPRRDRRHGRRRGPRRADRRRDRRHRLGHRPAHGLPVPAPGHLPVRLHPALPGPRLLPAGAARARAARRLRLQPTDLHRRGRPRAAGGRPVARERLGGARGGVRARGRHDVARHVRPQGAAAHPV